MTRVDTSGSGPAGPRGQSGLGPSDSTTSTVFADLAPPLGPLEAVERLRILETLSYGVLYEGRVFQASRVEEVSLLEVDPTFQSDPATLARLLAGLMAASRLRDANVASPRGVYRHGNSLYILLDTCAGVSLATAFDFLGRSSLRLSSEAILRVASGVLAALDGAARGNSGEEEPAAFHGLLTPENVFVGEGQRVLVRGFGLWAAGINRLGLLGPNERRYLSPSQNRSGTVSPRTDLLSLGTMLFEAVVGIPAFDAPPEEEDFSELRTSVEELRGKADPSMHDLFEVILSCLSPPPLVTSSYRARLRTAIDTLFLGEFSRDRAAKTLSLEELVGRVKPRRPAIVRVTPLLLEPAEAEPTASAAIDETPEAAGDGSKDQSAPTLSERAPAMARGSSAGVAPEPEPRSWIRRLFPTGGMRISSTFLAFGGAALAIGALVAIFWSSWPRSEQSVEESRLPALERFSGPAPAPAVPRPVEAPTAAIAPPPTIANTEKAPIPAPPAVLEAERRPAREAPRASPRRAPAPQKTTRRRASVDRGRKPQAGAAAGIRGPAPDTAPPAAPVAPGTLVSLGTPGLIAPVLIEAPPKPRYGESDPRPAVERSVTLEILVSDSGRVRGSRILRTDRLPPGFSGGAERYLSALRFQPAALGGVPVRVWIPYELRFLAP
jgi:outer membrane biosynthesis protein TonB